MDCASCDIASLTSLIQNLEVRNKEQEEIIKEQEQTIFHLHSLLETSQSRITELEARLGLHSGNSSFPPSHDLVPSPKPVSLRKKSGLKAGGQKNVTE
jgi:hypothetical protein